MKPKEFLGLTFREFQSLNEIWLNERTEYVIALNESMRLQTYFIYSLNVTKKDKKTFEQFRNHVMPFEWDKKDPKVVESSTTISQMSDNDWAERERRLSERNKKMKTEKYTI